MACKCSPSLVRLMNDFAKRGHVNSGCCGDAAHRARKSDHNPDSSGYAHAQDIHEKQNHDMQKFVDFIMKNPQLYPQVKYLIYEGFMYYPNDGARRAGKYTYTGPNAHASHLHVSIHATATNYAGSWFVSRAMDGGPTPPEEEEEVKPYVIQVAGHHRYCVQGDAMFWLGSEEAIASFTKAFGPVLHVDATTFENMKRALNSDVSPDTPAA